MISTLGIQISPRTSGHIVVAVCVIVIVVNLTEALQLAYLWSALKWEPETEWDSLRFNGVRVAVGLVCGYMLWTCLAALIGLIGALKHIPAFLRFFRDCSIVDIVFSFMFTVVVAFCTSRPATRALLCEHLSRQPELLRSVANSGLNFKNCELWFENAIVTFVCVMFITLVMRVQFTFTLSNLYTRMLRKQRLERLDSAPQRILLLPPSTDIPLAGSDDPQHVLVYAPVRHTLESAHELGATEAWVSNHRRHRSSSAGSANLASGGLASRSKSGQIQLQIEEDEGLLPSGSPSSAHRISHHYSSRPRAASNPARGANGVVNSLVDAWRDSKEMLKRI